MYFQSEMPIKPGDNQDFTIQVEKTHGDASMRQTFTSSDNNRNSEEICKISLKVENAMNVLDNLQNDHYQLKRDTESNFQKLNFEITKDNNSGFGNFIGGIIGRNAKTEFNYSEL